VKSEGILSGVNHYAGSQTDIKKVLNSDLSSKSYFIGQLVQNTYLRQRVSMLKR
jgi:hypothetical protein